MARARGPHRIEAFGTGRLLLGGDRADPAPARCDAPERRGRARAMPWVGVLHRPARTWARSTRARPVRPGALDRLQGGPGPCGLARADTALPSRAGVRAEADPRGPAGSGHRLRPRADGLRADGRGHRAAGAPGRDVPVL